MNNRTPLIVANLKANKTWHQLSVWLDQVGHSNKVQSFPGTIIAAPSAPFLAAASQRIKTLNLPLKLASQDISKFGEGAYTGEFTASQIADICQYCIIGHSERRKYFSETDRDIIDKLRLLLDAGVTPILCISDLNQLDSFLNQEKAVLENALNIIFVHEPPGAISGGGPYHPQTPQEANFKAALIRKKLGRKVITIYGGSINPDNVAAFLAQENIVGGLVGQASVDPRVFIQVIQNSTI